MNNVSEIVGPIVSLGVLAWVVRIWLAHRRFNKVVQLQADMQNKLLEKFDTSQELVEYLRTDGGAGFMETLRSAAEERTSPFARIFNSLQWGVALTFAGAALLFIQQQLRSQDEGTLILGTMCLAIGLGLLVSGAVAYALSRSWGLIDGRHRQSEAGL